MDQKCVNGQLVQVSGSLAVVPCSNIFFRVQISGAIWSRASAPRGTRERERETGTVYRYYTSAYQRIHGTTLRTTVVRSSTALYFFLSLSYYIIVPVNRERESRVRTITVSPVILHTTTYYIQYYLIRSAYYRYYQRQYIMIQQYRKTGSLIYVCTLGERSACARYLLENW